MRHAGVPPRGQVRCQGGFADPRNTEDVPRLKDMAKRQILEEVFGEFRPMLRRVERAIYELDWEEARDALRDLEMEMRY